MDNPGNPRGTTSNVQVCRQGDPNCDFDIDPRRCTFHVRVCLNNTDVNLPACQPGEVGAYGLRHPGGRTARSILDPVAALAPSSRSGTHMSVINFSPPDATRDQCTAMLPLRVALSRPLAIKVQAASPTGTSDKDTVRLKCVRRLRRR